MKHFVMKQHFFSLILTAQTLLFTIDASAQSCSAAWTLTADANAIVNGSITAPSQKLGASSDTSLTMAVLDFDGSSAFPHLERLNLNGKNWPTETVQNDGRFVQYSLSPKPGKTLTIQSVAMNLGCYGTVGHFFANIY
jgi:hypothetical protein